MQTLLIDVSALGPWAELVTAALAGVGIVVLIMLYKRSERLEARLGVLDALDRLEGSVEALKEGLGGVDLERLEHLVEDLRDTNRRIGRQLVELAERSVEMEPESLERVQRPVGAMLGERITNRLIFLGCERIELLVGAGDLERIAAEGGDVGFEARRDGAVAKGQVSIADGRLVDVDISTSHQMFP
jgi:hypothetical protein